MEMKLQDSIIEEFSSPITQDIYIKAAETGLWKSEKKLILKHFKKGSKILDIGCGTGRTTIALRKLDYDVTGIDITPAMIKSAKKISKRKNLQIKYEQGDATRLRFKERSFDNALFSFNGWTQIPGRENRQKALGEVFRVLKPGGHHIFTANRRQWRGRFWFWIRQWLRVALLKNLMPVDEIDFGDRFFEIDGRGRQYIHIPSKREVVGQISKAGFTLVYSEMSGNIAKQDDNNNALFFVCRRPKVI